MKPTFSGEMQLAGWSESHNSGCKVTFWLADPDDLQAFKSMTARKGNQAGQRLMAALVEIGDDEQPVQEPEKQKGGPLSKEAAMLCQNPSFQHWAFHHLAAISKSEEGASERVRGLCGVGSRAMLDADEVAGNRFINNIRTPFIRWQRERATEIPADPKPIEMVPFRRDGR